MKSITFSKRASAVLGAAVAATLSAGIASAVWTSPTGGGNGSATGYTALKADVTSATANTAAALFPGSSVTNTVTITNPNPYPIKVTAIRHTTGSAAVGNCATDTVDATDRVDSSGDGLVQSNGTTRVIAANNGTGTYDVVLTMATSAHNDCQGDPFSVPLTISSESSGF